MNDKVKVYTHFFSVIFFTSTILAGLFFMIGTTFRPLPAAARNLETNTLVSAKQEPLNSFAPPPSPLLQASGVATIYLPLVHRNPTTVYLDEFGNKNSGWPTGDDGNCNSLYDGGRYRLDVKADKECFRFAPKAAERTYGWFGAVIYHSDGESDSAYGLYLNGKGGNNYYLFRIRPNNSCSSGGGWEFIRRRDGNNTTLLNVSCDSRIKRGYGSGNANALLVQHNSGGQIILLINGVQVAAAFNDSLELTNTGTGVYARASSSKDIIVKVISFGVFVP
ncbi:MAG: hypothetical protein HYR94_24070 [Chloroflexi bacterium]|nr:hypothetical protein [Chloroflexota bacterium]